MSTFHKINIFEGFLSTRYQAMNKMTGVIAVNAPLFQTVENIQEKRRNSQQSTITKHNTKTHSGDESWAPA